MFGKKAQINRMLIAIILAVIALTLFILFYTGQWDKLIASLTTIEDSAIGSAP